MLKRRCLSFVLVISVILTTFVGMTVSAEQSEDGEQNGTAFMAAVTLYVDKNAELSDTTFNTICDAVARAKEINPQSEAEMVTINVEPGDYEEQVIFDNMKFVTIRQTPGTSGTVDLHWYYCTGYAAANVNLSGDYDASIDWYGNPPSDASGKTYAIGEAVAKGTVLTYKDVNGNIRTETVKSDMFLGNTGGLSQMAALIVRNNSEYITVKDLNIVNSVPVMATQAEKDAHLTPRSDFPNLPNRSKLADCTEDTAEEVPTDLLASNGQVDIEKYNACTRELTAGESVWLARSGVFNERGHAVSIYSGDKITFENIRLRGGQDSLYASGGRTYFKNCDIIGGTDYIYGSGTVVFDNCKLGLEGFSDRVYGSPITAANTDAKRKYGYLFYNCTAYNVRDNGGTHNYGGPWGAGAQVTFYNTTLDDAGTVGNSAFSLDPIGWHRFGAENGLARIYEFGTKNTSEKAIDYSKRVVNKSTEDGGSGMGTVLDRWQILEFNPRNYFSAECGGWSDDWDPMGFAAQLADVDAAIEGVMVNVPENESTTIELPTAPDGISFKWESASTNAVVSEDGTKLTVIRPAAGENNIETKVTLYAMDNDTGYGDKKEIPVNITPTTNTTDVFNVPVTVTESVALAEDADYYITISKNSAVIKKQTVTVPAGQLIASDVIENIPANAEGIDYDIKVVSHSDEMTIVMPSDGVSVIKGVTGQNVELKIEAQKQIDEIIDIDIDYSSNSGVQKYDLIALAKKAGASDSITASDQITVSYKLDVTRKTTGSGFIDILSSEPADTCKTSGVSSRFLLGKLGHWNQLDYVDSAQSYSGSSNGPDQWLNACGKFDTKTVSETSVYIDYKTLSLSASGVGTNKESSYKFETFPASYEKGKLYMAIYPGTEEFEIKDVTITYKRVVKSGEINATPTSDPVIETATPAPATATPDNDPVIVNAYIENGNTVAELNNIENGVVIAAKYDGDAMTDMKYADVSGSNILIEGIEADKVMVWNALEDMQPLCEVYIIGGAEPTTEPGGEIAVDFTSMSSVPVYSKAAGQGFVENSSAIMPDGYERQVAPVTDITVSSEGAKVTESSGSYIHEKANSNDGDDYNYGGLIYRIDTGAAGAYHLEVEITGTKDDTRVAPTGMDAGRLTGTANWDNAGEVPRTVSALWSGSVWSYDFATGQDFIEIEIEPLTLASVSSPKTVGVKSIKVTPLDVNPAGSKPTIHILGDSTQKTYTFNETISSWGQTIGNYFDLSKVNVVNYSMGGRAMKSNYCEGRFDEVLVTGKAGDFVFIHSAHNDETISANRFSRGSGTAANNLEVNNASYNRWLDMYVDAIKARGMTPVLVTAMPRTGSGVYSESAVKPNGFNPDSPGNMRAKAASDPEVGLIELYDGAKKYIDSLDAKEVMYIYNNIEAGETPANNSANGANGDGTHYREAAAKQWCRIMLRSIYEQSSSLVDIYTDKSIMQKLVSYMPDSVKNAAQSGDWSAVFPEMASDVSAVDVVPGAVKQSESNYYYRNNIEKVLQLGLMHKDSNNLFKPQEAMTVGEFARAMEKVFGLEENSLTSYTKTYAELGAAAVSLASIDEAVLAADEQYTVTVQQPEGGEVIVYNESAFHTATSDVPANVTANSVISDNEYFTLTAPSEIVNKSDKNASFSNKAISVNAIEVRNNGTKQPSYIAKESGVITLYLYFDNTKIITCENKTDGKKSEKYIEGEKADADNRTNVFGEVQFDVEAGKTYELYTNGGTGRLFGVMYASNDYPQSTESLVVNSGDEIRVAARPADNYLNKAILINGIEAANTREYKFRVTSDTTVSASFTAEPELVTETVIASDAALTREAMGAIIYDAYLAAYGKEADGSWNKVVYMNQNGGVPSPDDPNYDPNISYEGSPYIPLTGWGALADIGEIDSTLYSKVKEVYNLGLIRSEQGITRGSVACGNVLEPKTVVTRAKAAKTLNFVFILTQKPNDASQKLPNGNQAAVSAEIVQANPDAPSVPIN